MHDRAARTDVPMKPQVIAHELGMRLRNDAIVSCDSGTIATWWARHIPVKKGQIHSLSGNLASMANGLPYTIAAQIAHPERQCVAFVGDGGFSMLMADFATAVKYQLPIKVVVVNERHTGPNHMGADGILGNPEYGVDLQPIDFAGIAQACGGIGFTADNPSDCGRIVEEFLATPGPAVLQAVVDPLEAPASGQGYSGSGIEICRVPCTRRT